MLISIVLFGILCVFMVFPGQARAGDVDEDQLGAWYMYFWSTQLKESRFGFQGDFQFRNWDLLGDLAQLLIRGGVTYAPIAMDVKFTLVMPLF